MKKIFKKLGIIAIICGVLSPFVTLPKVNAANNCKHYLNQYLYLGVTSGLGLESFVVEDSDDLKDVGERNFTSFLYTFPEINSNQVLTIESAGEVDLSDDENELESYHSAYKDLINSSNKDDMKKINKFGNWEESEFDDYESVTTLIHGYWASDDDGNGEANKADWGETLDTFKKLSTFKDSTLQYNFGDDLELFTRFGGAKFDVSDNEFSVVRENDYKYDLEAFLNKVIADVNSGVSNSDSHNKNYVYELNDSLYFNTTIVRNIEESDIEDLDFGCIGCKNETGGTQTNTNTKYVLSTSPTEKKDSYIALQEMYENSNNYCEESDGCYLLEGNFDVDVHKNYYWPVMYNVEYSVCDTASSGDDAPANPTVLWKLKYNANVKDITTVTDMPGDSEQVNVGKSIKVTDKVPKREGYVLNGWCTKENGSGDCYKAGEEAKYSVDTTLYANWGEEGPTDNKKTGVVSYIIGFAAVGVIAGTIYLVSKKKNLFKQI